MDAIFNLGKFIQEFPHHVNGSKIKVQNREKSIENARNEVIIEEKCFSVSIYIFSCYHEHL